MKLLNKTVLVGIASVLAALGNPSAAHAIVFTIIPGATCTTHFGSAVADIAATSSFIYANKGVGVTCPVLKTDRNQTQVWVSVFVYRDSSTTQALSCTLYSTEWNGAGLGGNSQIFSGNGGGRLLVGLPASANSAFSHLALTCYLPPKSKIYNLNVSRY